MCPEAAMRRHEVAFGRTYRVLAVLDAFEGGVAVQTRELGVVAAVSVRVELLLGHDIAAGL